MIRLFIFLGWVGRGRLLMWPQRSYVERRMCFYLLGGMEIILILWLVLEIMSKLLFFREYRYVRIAAEDCIYKLRIFFSMFVDQDLGLQKLQSRIFLVGNTVNQISNGSFDVFSHMMVLYWKKKKTITRGCPYFYATKLVSKLLFHTHGWIVKKFC